MSITMQLCSHVNLLTRHFNLHLNIHVISRIVFCDKVAWIPQVHIFAGHMWTLWLNLAVLKQETLNGRCILEFWGCGIEGIHKILPSLISGLEVAGIAWVKPVYATSFGRITLSKRFL